MYCKGSLDLQLHPILSGFIKSFDMDMVNPSFDLKKLRTLRSPQPAHLPLGGDAGAILWWRIPNVLFAPGWYAAPYTLIVRYIVLKTTQLFGLTNLFPNYSLQTLLYCLRMKQTA